MRPGNGTEHGDHAPFGGEQSMRAEQRDLSFNSNGTTIRQNVNRANREHRLFLRFILVSIGKVQT
jgi:hypothetical protein